MPKVTTLMYARRSTLEEWAKPKRDPYEARAMDVCIGARRVWCNAYAGKDGLPKACQDCVQVKVTMEWR